MADAAAEAEDATAGRTGVEKRLIGNMPAAPTATAASDRLQQLVGRIEALPDFAEVVESLQAGHAATLDGVWGSSCALIAAALVRAAPLCWSPYVREWTRCKASSVT